jgi:hypothetical protein
MDTDGRGQIRMKIRLDERMEKLTKRIIGSAFEVLNEPEARISPRAAVIISRRTAVNPCLSVFIRVK